MSKKQAYFTAVVSCVVLLSLASVLVLGMLPAFLSLCAAYALACDLTPLELSKARGRQQKALALVVGAIPVMGLTLLALALGESAPLIHQELTGVSQKMVEFLQTWRQTLPAQIEKMIPAQSGLSEYLVEQIKQRAGVLAGMGKTWLGGALQVVVGAIIGALLYLDTRQPHTRSGLGAEIATRASQFIEVFKGVVTAQLVIASVNTAATALFLFAVLPLFEVRMPYALGLVTITFIGGLIPIVGNLMCNAVLTLVALSVGPAVALASLAFLIAVHKSEYFINAAVVGKKTNIAVWELLVAIFLGEALFGVTGLIAAPLYYAYLKQELARFELGRPIPL